MRLAVRAFSGLRPATSRHAIFPTSISQAQSRCQTTASHNNITPATDTLSPRWLADVKQRLGKCITFGLKPEQTARAGAVLHTLSQDWRELVAGSEGFLTDEDRRGLHRHQVVWGEMDSMVSRVSVAD